MQFDATRRRRMYDHIKIPETKCSIFIEPEVKVSKSARVWSVVKGEEVSLDPKFVTARDRLRKCYDKLRAQKESRKIQIIEFVPPPPPQLKKRSPNATQNVRCAATTLKGKQCPFRATCGKFCKKHNI